MTINEQHMKTNANYRNHPLLPLMQLLDSIETPTEFMTRRNEILHAIHLAKPILKDRTPECCRLAKGGFYASHGTATVPFRMARFVESSIKETLHLSDPPKKRNGSKSMIRQPRITHHTEPVSITFHQLRELLPAIATIRSLGGRAEIDIHNPAGAYLTVTNSKGNRYFITEANWNDANTIRRSNAANPWASQIYNNYHLPEDHGLYHAAAILRAIEEGDLLELGNIAA
jgi:hypothetical protein